MSFSCSVLGLSESFEMPMFQQSHNAANSTLGIGYDSSQKYIGAYWRYFLKNPGQAKVNATVRARLTKTGSPSDGINCCIRYWDSYNGVWGILADNTSAKTFDDYGGCLSWTFKDIEFPTTITPRALWFMLYRSGSFDSNNYYRLWKTNPSRTEQFNRVCLARIADDGSTQIYDESYVSGKIIPSMDISLESHWPFQGLRSRTADLWLVGDDDPNYTWRRGIGLGDCWAPTWVDKVYMQLAKYGSPQDEVVMRVYDEASGDVVTESNEHHSERSLVMFGQTYDTLYSIKADYVKAAEYVSVPDYLGPMVVRVKAYVNVVGSPADQLYLSVYDDNKNEVARSQNWFNADEGDVSGYYWFHLPAFDVRDYGGLHFAFQREVSDSSNYYEIGHKGSTPSSTTAFMQTDTDEDIVYWTDYNEKDLDIEIQWMWEYTLESPVYIDPLVKEGRAYFLLERTGATDGDNCWELKSGNNSDGFLASAWVKSNGWHFDHGANMPMCLIHILEEYPIVDYVKALSTDRGKSSFTGRYYEGEANIDIKDMGGRWYRFLKLNTVIRIVANGYNLFKGKLAESEPNMNFAEQVTTLQISDWFREWKDKEISVSVGNKRADEQINAVLDEMDVPGRERDIQQAGDLLLQPKTYENEEPLSILEEIIEACRGHHFTSGGGLYTFRNSSWVKGVAVKTYRDSDSILIKSALKNVDNIKNKAIVVGYPSENEYKDQDDESIERYGKRTIRVDNDLVPDETEAPGYASNVAGYLVDASKDPHGGPTVILQNILPDCFSRGLGDIIQVANPNWDYYEKLAVTAVSVKIEGPYVETELHTELYHPPIPLVDWFEVVTFDASGINNLKSIWKDEPQQSITAPETGYLTGVEFRIYRQDRDNIWVNLQAFVYETDVNEVATGDPVVSSDLIENMIFLGWELQTVRFDFTGSDIIQWASGDQYAIQVILTDPEGLDSFDDPQHLILRCKTDHDVDPYSGGVAAKGDGTLYTTYTDFWLRALFE